jgi:SAM-dependent methyltransferase
MNSACIGCAVGQVEPLADFGVQPPSNRFFPAGEPQTDAHRLALGQCAACALVQLVEPMPVAMVRSRHAWLAYNEPEGHLDRLTEELIAMTSLPAGARVAGLSYKDDSTLARFNRRGYTNTLRFDMVGDLGIGDPLAGLETIQEALTPERARAIAARHGQVDLLLVRHVLEHAHAPRRFLAALALLVKPHGLMVFEMPESRKFLAARDYSFVWEEHIAYFTEATIARFVAGVGLDPWRVLSYEYPLEDSLVTVVRPRASTAATSAPSAAELALGRDFGGGFRAAAEQTRAALERVRAAGKRVAVFGAGHLAAKFLNLFRLGGLVECVVDDNAHKLGLRMPGSALEIRPSTVLLEERIDLCLLSLSPESEKKVIAASQAYLERGGEFRSIFRLSPIAFGGTA